MFRVIPFKHLNPTKKNVPVQVLNKVGSFCSPGARETAGVVVMSLNVSVTLSDTKLSNKQSRERTAEYDKLPRAHSFLKEYRHQICSHCQHQGNIVLYHHYCATNNTKFVFIELAYSEWDVLEVAQFL